MSVIPLPSSARRAPVRRAVRGVLLDLDGTLIDSIAAVERSWIRWCGEYGVDPVRLLGFHGVTAASVIAALLPEAGGWRRSSGSATSRWPTSTASSCCPVPPTCSPRSPRAACRPPSSPPARRDLAEARIAATGLTHPPVVVTASDVERGKPWPDPWLEGAHRLGVDPADCVVVEDAVAGLRAGRAAGCRALVAVLGTTPREELEPLADLVVPDLSHLTSSVEGGRLWVAGA